MPIIRMIIQALTTPADEGRQANSKPKDPEEAPGDDVEAHEEHGHSTDKPKKLRIILHAVVQAVLPFVFFNLCTTQGWHDYVDLLTEDPLGGLLSWVPFILIMALASVNPVLAIWLAFGIMTLIILAELYHHTYKPVYPRFYWFSCFNWMAFLGMGIADTIQRFDYNLISPITVSSLLAAVVASMLVCQPFTLQFSRPNFPEEVTKTPFFLKMNWFFTEVWLALFVIMATCSWLAWALPLDKDSAGYTILGTVIPILLPLAGIKLSPILGKWYMDHYGPKKAPQATADEETEEQQTN